MKTTHYPILLLCFLCLVSCELQDKVETGCVPLAFEKTYSYPIRPGSSEWNGLNSRDEMMAVQQIPENQLQDMDTGSLIESLLRLPSILDFVLFDDFQDGFEGLYTSINSFSELYSRPDLNHAFLSRLELIRPECENIYPPLTAEGTYHNTDISLQALDMFLLQNEYLESLSRTEQIKLLETVYHSISRRRSLGFNDFSLIPAHALLGKLMIRLAYDPFLQKVEDYPFLAHFSERVPVYRPNDLNPIEVIFKNAEEFMN